MSNNQVEIINIIDKSGSMATRRDDAIGGFNVFLAEQKKDPTVVMSALLFDVGVQWLYENLPVAQVSPLTAAEYCPGGCTALLDAVGGAIDRVGARLGSLPEEQRPRKVIMVVLTDGEENSSRKYEHSAVADRIKHQQERYGWEFVFLASGINAWTTGGALHIPAANTAQVDLTSAQGVAASFTSYTATVNKLKATSLS